MADTPDSFEHYLAAWNERDVSRVGAHLAASVTDDVVFADPANYVVGPAAIEAMIVEARTASMPAAEYVIASGVDGHNRRYRYRWEVQVDGEVVMPGMDVTTVDAQGRIERIDGFFGDFPEA